MAEDDPNEARRQEVLARDKELRQRSYEEYAKRVEGVKPTPTQEENDRAALGEHVLDKEPSGAPPEEDLRPDVRGHVREREGRKVEARPQQRGAYETRAARPATTTPGT